MRSLLMLALAVLGAALAAACNIPVQCEASQLGAPGDLAPSAREIVGLTPSLTWTYPPSSPLPYPYPAGSPDCALSGYQVHLVQAGSEAIEYGGSSIYQNFAPAAPLLPATLYFWEVRAQSLFGNGPWSGYRAFYTGPVCEPALLGVPYLRYPADGSSVSELTPGFSWSRSSPCLPDAYQIDLSTDPAFSAINLGGDTGDPQTNWTPASALANCTTYYWRAASRVGTSLSTFSPTRSFNVAAGFCPPVLVIPSLVVPLVTVMPSPIPAASEAPVFLVKVNANCRYGPGLAYEPLTSVLAGQSFPVQGRNEQASWFYLLLPGRERCWVSAAVGQFSGDLNLVPIIHDLLPTPVTAPSSACHDYKDAASCKADPKGIGGCSWDLKKNQCVP